MMRKTGSILLTLAMLTGCVSTPAPADLIVGTWQSSLAGFTLTSIYTSTEVAVDGHAALPYSLDGKTLTLGGDTGLRRIISFPSRDEMVQLDPMTNTRHMFTRVAE